jgi:hypothetical protein
MNKYEGPAFEVKEDVVSIWAAKSPLADIPDDYFQETDGENDDEPFNQFSSDFGFGGYDNDFVGNNCTDDWRVVPIRELMEPLSYSRSFRDAAVQKAEALGLGQTSYVLLLYHFKYDTAISGIQESAHMRFIGVFPFDREE